MGREERGREKRDVAALLRLLLRLLLLLLLLRPPHLPVDPGPGEVTRPQALSDRVARANRPWVKRGRPRWRGSGPRRCITRLSPAPDLAPSDPPRGRHGAISHLPSSRGRGPPRSPLSSDRRPCKARQHTTTKQDGRGARGPHTPTHTHRGISHLPSSRGRGPPPRSPLFRRPGKALGLQLDAAPPLAHGKLLRQEPGGCQGRVQHLLQRRGFLLRPWVPARPGR